MPTVITGPQGDSNFPAVQTNQIDIDEEIDLLQGSKNIFAPMMMKLARRSATGQKSEWMEDEVVPVYTNITTSYNTVITTIVVTTGTGSYFAANDTVRNEITGEQMLVVSVATDTLTVVRGVGSVVGTASSGSTDGFIRVSNASPQGASYPTVKDTQVVGQFNYQQIFRKSIGLVKTATLEAFRGENDAVAYKKGKALLDLVRQTDQSIFLGRRATTTASTTNQGTQTQLISGGFQDYIATNITSINGTMTQAQWETFLRDKAFKYGELDSKLIICSPLVLQAISGFAASKLAPPSPEITRWGVRLGTYQSMLGSVQLMAHPDWGQYSAAATNNFSLGGAAFAIDMDACYLRGLRTTQWLENRQNPGDDAFIGEYLQELCLVVKNERHFAWLRGVTG
jgi:hypothetical protein